MWGRGGLSGAPSEAQGLWGPGLVVVGGTEARLAFPNRRDTPSASQVLHQPDLTEKQEWTQGSRWPDLGEIHSHFPSGKCGDSRTCLQPRNGFSLLPVQPNSEGLPQGKERARVPWRGRVRATVQAGSPGPPLLSAPQTARPPSPETRFAGEGGAASPEGGQAAAPTGARRERPGWGGASCGTRRAIVEAGDGFQKVRHQK